MRREFRTVGVVGLGTMGAGIVEVFARNGLQVFAAEVDEGAVERGRAHLESSLAHAIDRGKLTRADADDLLARVTTTTELADLAGADLVIEAVPEQIELKSRVLAALDKVCGPDTILASNTSSLSITELSVRTGRPGKVVGMHFFNPAPVLKLVELVRTVVTEQGVVDELEDFAVSLGKVPVVIGDRAGFIANGLLFGYLNHAARMFDQRYATREDLDAAMRHGCGYPMGPLALLDLIGLDTSYEILDTMYRQSRNQTHAPAPVLKQMITAGLLGRKSGRGFYTYAAPHSSEVVPDAFTPPGVLGLEGVVRDVQRVGVVGTGTMASGIVEVFARAGFGVLVRGRDESKVDGAIAGIRTSLDKAVVRGGVTATERAAAMARITGTTRLADFTDVELVVEAVAEQRDVKRAVFASLDEICKPGTILATTTSSLPVVECAAATSRPADVIGLHFFNPAPVMKLVEVVSTIGTAPEVAATALAVCQRLGKVRSPAVTGPGSSSTRCCSRT